MTTVIAIGLCACLFVGLEVSSADNKENEEE